MVIGGVPVYPGHPCPHSTGCGCDDYANRPKDPCDNFHCGWIVQGSPLPDSLKPNEGGLIVIFNKMKWNGMPVDLAVPVGAKIPAGSLEWMQRYAESNNRPLIYTEQIVEQGAFQKQQLVMGYGPPVFQQDLQRWQREGRTLW